RRNEDGSYSKVNVEQPADRGILLKDVLDSAVARDMVAEPINTDANGKAFCVTSRYYKGFGNNPGKCLEKHRDSMVAEPINATANGKAKTISASCAHKGDGADAKTGLYVVPYDCDVVITENSIRCQRRDQKHSTVQGSHLNFTDGKTQTLSPSHIPNVIERKDGKEITIYEVKDGKITIKGKQYPIKLKDGYYIIRKLTVSECKRLQTVPEWYDFSVISNSQAFKCLGNGWTCEIICHLINSCFKPADVLPGQMCLWG
ncbi:MAG: DNA cytosine methyltransferase, partial [Clostridium sp.]|nr:DNA cytosine methyltransferase [Clostridium sp.]